MQFTLSHYVTAYPVFSATRAPLCAFFLLYSTAGILDTSFFCLAGPSPLHETGFLDFSLSPLRREHNFRFYLLS